MDAAAMALKAATTGDSATTTTEMVMENVLQFLVVIYLIQILSYFQNEFSYLASGSRDRTVKLWDSINAICLMTFNCHENWVRQVIFHPSYKYIISCSDDKSIRVLDIKVSGLTSYHLLIR
jgi:WD40 repeat protein